MSRIERLFSSRFGLLVIFAAFAAIYLGTAGGRLRSHSPYNHFVYLADGWLKGRLDLPQPPPNENDWARVEVIKLRDGRELKGQFRTGGPTDRFYPLRGPSVTVPADEIVTRNWIRYVSFPPFPAVLMLPFVAVSHLAFNDVLFTAIWAAINPVLLFLLLRRLQKRGCSKRGVTDDLLLTVLFGVGSVYYFSSVLGQVWFTAHVIGVTCVIGYAWASIDAAWPALAGLCVGLGFATRTPLGFMVPLFVFEAVRATGGWARLRQWRVEPSGFAGRETSQEGMARPSEASAEEEGVWGQRAKRTRPGSHRELRSQGLPPGLLAKLVRFAVPAAAVLGVLLVHNFLRFGKFSCFGHEYLNISWQDRIQRYGLFNYHFLSRNLACALVLLPRVLAQYPWVKVSTHGMSLLVTTPNLAYTVAPAERNPLSRALWLTVLATAVPSLLYQNSGYVQFGYRFSLDYMVFLIMILAIGNRRFGWLFRTFVVLAIVVNTFGAITFDRMSQFSYEDTFFPHGNN